ncbi:MAG: hypothetical protein B0D92_04075 [Spirochaeta sp. LUC14_002_19_P3]|nr:MAG: hypothetical protein B0D92_04075 [Spirochaeta sp. LUC14_002_19_P3]
MTAVLTTRHGGASKAPGAGLNMGLGDEAVEENRRRVAAALGLPENRWAMCRQVHGLRIRALSGKEEPPFADCDGVIIDEPGWISGVQLADCHPVLLYDPVNHVAAAAHAGWRGTLSEIPRLLTEQMVERGSRPANLYAAAGPGIGQCCYTVGEDVAALFADKFADRGSFLVPAADGAGWQLNLEEINVQSLRAAGVPPGQIGRGGLCTACNLKDFYSHRREHGLTGRYAALMAVHAPN